MTPATPQDGGRLRGGLSDQIAEKTKHMKFITDQKYKTIREIKQPLHREEGSVGHLLSGHRMKLTEL